MVNAKMSTHKQYRERKYQSRLVFYSFLRWGLANDDVHFSIGSLLLPLPHAQVDVYRLQLGQRHTIHCQEMGNTRRI